MKRVLVFNSRQLSVLLTVLACAGGALVAHHRTEEIPTVLLAGRGVWPDFRAFLPVRPRACTRYPNGTCFSPSRCAQLGGLAEGACVSGTCCYLLTPTKENEVAEIRTCGETTSGNGTSFVNPSYPGTDTTVSNCRLKVELLSDVCQLRLDFDTFVLAQPNFNGGCDTDFMKIAGTAHDGAVPILCGANTGKHMYVDLDPTGGSPKIIINTGVTSSTSREWNITVQQIPCDSRYRAPEGCTQYYTGSSGVVESFNYATPTEAQITSLDTNLHLNNLRYSVCVAPRPGYCSITWSKNDNGGTNPYTFFMSGDGSAFAPSMAGTLGASSGGAANCPSDYVIIPGGEFVNPADLTTTLQADRFCGLGFPNQVTSSVLPFVLMVTTDESEWVRGDTVNVGFSLQYRQNAC